jgi:Domain of unknown function (DUF1906)
MTEPTPAPLPAAPDQIEAPAAAAAAPASPLPAAAAAAPKLAEPHVWLMADISDPGADVIGGPMLVAFAFYLGGNTPHVWTRAQLDRQTLRYAMPVWVYGARQGAAGGRAEGQDAAAALHALGVPRGVAVRVDMETAVDVDYLRTFREQVNLAGYWYGPYGSASTVFGNPQGGAGYWVADWTGLPHEFPHEHVTATQYASAEQANTPWDLSELVTLAHCWDRRPPAVVPAGWPAVVSGGLEQALNLAGDAEARVRAALITLKAHGG